MSTADSCVMIRGRLTNWILLAVGFVDAACSGPTDRRHPATKAVGHDSGVLAVDAGTPTIGDWFTYLTADWQLDPGAEGWVCVRKTADRDLYIDGWDGIQPLGTHHELLSMGAPDMEDGVTTCSPADVHDVSLYGTALGTKRFELPSGVAMKIPVGQQVLLNLHVFNSSQQPLLGTSGIRARLADPSAIEHEAGMLLTGTADIEIPADSQTTLSGTCTLWKPVTIFAAAPHMHQKGTYLHAAAHTRAGTVVLNDAPYSFDEQLLHAVDPAIAMDGGDTVDVDCTYRNDTNANISFGNSSNAEMCWVVLLHYPLLGSQFCTH